jgi:release factor glutamine methyltransferase
MPDEDTHLLLGAVCGEIRPQDRVLEIGTGSGYIAARVPSPARVVATEINPHAARIARSAGVEVVRTDLGRGICARFDLIVFNPPYLPTRPEERIDDWLEFALDGGLSGRRVIEGFAAAADGLLATGGRILLLCSSLTGPDEVRRLFARNGFVCFIAAKRTVEDETLYVLRAVRDPCMEKEVKRGMGSNP